MSDEESLEEALPPPPSFLRRDWCQMFNSAVNVAYSISGCNLKGRLQYGQDRSDLPLDVFDYDEDGEGPCNEPCKIPFQPPLCLEEATRARSSSSVVEGPTLSLGERVFHPTRIGATSQVHIKQDVRATILLSCH